MILRHQMLGTAPRKSLFITGWCSPQGQIRAARRPSVARGSAGSNKADPRRKDSRFACLFARFVYNRSGPWRLRTVKFTTIAARSGKLRSGVTAGLGPLHRENRVSLAARGKEVTLFMPFVFFNFYQHPGSKSTFWKNWFLRLRHSFRHFENCWKNN